MAASGALAFDGKGWLWEQPLKWMGLFDPSLFTVVIKTLTREPRKGNLRWYNPFGCVRILPGGTVNAVGLTNPGIDWWCKNIGLSVDRTRIPLMGSILGEPQELADMARMLNDFDLVGLEINASCPNTPDDLLTNTHKVVESIQAVRGISRFPLILKLSVVHEVEQILQDVGGLVDALSINSVPWTKVFSDRKSPLAHLGGGGVSGKLAQPLTWNLVNKLVRISSTPVIGPSIWEFSDIARLRTLGARAISFGAVFIPYPWRPTLFVKKEQKEAIYGYE
ncbi:MAG: hypothetical protein ABH837_02495 [bacterium]